MYQSLNRFLCFVWVLRAVLYFHFKSLYFNIILIGFTLFLPLLNLNETEIDGTESILLLFYLYIVSYKVLDKYSITFLFFYITFLFHIYSSDIPARYVRHFIYLYNLRQYLNTPPQFCAMQYFVSIHLSLLCYFSDSVLH